MEVYLAPSIGHFMLAILIIGRVNDVPGNGSLYPFFEMFSAVRSSILCSAVVLLEDCVIWPFSGLEWFWFDLLFTYLTKH